jgi:hypothetical protein
MAIMFVNNYPFDIVLLDLFHLMPLLHQSPVWDAIS